MRTPVQYFSIGILSWALALLLPALYIAVYLVRHTAAWFRGKAGPTDRKFAFFALYSAFGFVAGSMLQPYWDEFKPCIDFGHPVVQCARQSQRS
jgi:hypothetical protein